MRRDNSQIQPQNGRKVSFLAYQRDMAKRKGQSNAHTLFGLTEIPCDNQIRTLLDPVPPELLGPVFDHGFNSLVQTQQRAAFRSWQKRLLVVLDGTQYFSSQNLSCPPEVRTHVIAQ